MVWRASHQGASMQASMAASKQAAFALCVGPGAAVHSEPTPMIQPPNCN